jgi:RNA polymerase sigma-70 factor (ECF subfamily)
MDPLDDHAHRDRPSPTGRRPGKSSASTPIAHRASSGSEPKRPQSGFPHPLDTDTADTADATLIPDTFPNEDVPNQDFPDADSSSADPEMPQPFHEDGVHPDMATATYERGWLLSESAADNRSNRIQDIQVDTPASRRQLAGGAVPDEDSDAAIMLRVRDGDDTGFTFLIEKYRRQMIHFMFRMTANQAVAEELAQEVFLRVYRSRESYRAEAKFTTWLYRIATNLGVNYARDHKHEKAAQNVYLDQPDAETGTTPDVADSRLTVEQSILRNERLSGIRAQVMALPERQRQAVFMHKYQEMDYREIGAVLKLSESATKSLLFRAYQTLRDRLKEYV